MTKKPTYEELEKRVKGLEAEVLELRENEAALHQTEEKFRSLVERANDGIGIIQDGIMRYANPALAAMGDYTVDEIVGVPFTDFVHPSEVDKASDYYKRRMEGEEIPQKYELLFLHKDGRTICGEVSGGIITYEEKPANLVVIRDVTERKRTEEALRESQDKYRHLVEEVNDVIYSTDEQGVITYISPVLESVTGHRPSEVVGRPFSDFIHPEDLPWILEKFQKVIAGDMEPNEYRLIGASGDVRWVRSSSRPILEGDRSIGLRGVMRDITQRKEAELELQETSRRLKIAYQQALQYAADLKEEVAERKRKEEQLKEREEQFRQVAQSIDDVFWIRDAGTSELVYVSPAFEKIYGISCEAAYENPFSFMDLVAPADIQKIRLAQQNQTTEAKETVTEYRINRPDGEMRWIRSKTAPVFDDNGILIRTVGIATDITGGKLAEEALKESERRFWTLAESAPIGLYETDAQGGCLYVNKKWRDMAGLTLEEALGDGWQKSLHQEDRGHVFQFWREYSRSPQRPWDREYRFCTPAGEVSWVIGTTTVLRDAYGRVTGYLGANLDITERKLAEEALRVSEERLRKTQRIAKIGGWSWEIASGRAEWSDQVYEIFKAPRKKPSYAFARSFVHPHDLDVWQNAIEQAIEKRAPFTLEYRAVRSDGETIWVRNETKALFNEGGELIGYEGTLQDITDPKQAEEALKRKEQELEDQAHHLEETNAALKVLLELRDKEREELEERVVNNVKKTVFPYLEDLEKSLERARNRTCVCIVKSNLEHLVSPFASKLSEKTLNLTPTELRVADMVKHGKTSKEIASLLNVSPDAILFHRKNIRKRLGLAKKKVNLRSYLQALSTENR